MIRVPVVLCLLLYLRGVAVAAGWPREPAGFRGLPWGATIDEAKKAFPEASAPPVGNFLVIDSFEVGTVRARVEMTFKGFGSESAGGGLWMVSMTFPLRDMGTMKALFIKKYGQPTGHHTEGGDWTLDWKGKQVDIELGPDSYAREGTAVFTVRAVNRQILKEKAEIRAREKANQEKKKRSALDAF